MNSPSLIKYLAALVGIAAQATASTRAPARMSAATAEAPSVPPGCGAGGRGMGPERGMTVAELIAHLQALPPMREVFIAAGERQEPLTKENLSFLGKDCFTPMRPLLLAPTASKEA